ncbi:MAG TPA: hypothetical protein VK466_11715, partial [Terriglobales bacterium]|nr:hypothetical protein [Terriglobales bacterium]
MRRLKFVLIGVALSFSSLFSDAQQPAPHQPVLDISSMDTSADPCADFFQYSCGGWNKRNPIPPDQPSWSVYGKLADENRAQL